jgi:hypothetical protein
VELAPGALESQGWRRVRSNVFPYAALLNGVHWVVLRLNGFPDHPLYTLFIDGERIFDVDVLTLGSRPEYEPLSPEERREVLTLMRGLGPYGAEAGRPCDGDFCACGALTDDFAAREIP